jgi:hypothetical protein
MNTSPRMTPRTGARNEGVLLGLGTAEGGSVGRGVAEVPLAWYGYHVVILDILYGCRKRPFRVAFEETPGDGAVIVALPVPVPPIFS